MVTIVLSSLPSLITNSYNTKAPNYRAVGSNLRVVRPLKQQSSIKFS